jgi:DnaK suppressor protein
MAKTTHTKEFIAEMKGVLEGELQKLESSLERITHKGVDGRNDANFPEYGDGEDENANEIAEYENNLSLEHELQKALRDVRNALTRIEDGSYGICKYSGELISEDRLRARPTSTSSIASKKTLTQEL